MYRKATFFFSFPFLYCTSNCQSLPPSSLLLVRNVRECSTSDALQRELKPTIVHVITIYLFSSPATGERVQAEVQQSEKAFCRVYTLQERRFGPFKRRLLNRNRDLSEIISHPPRSIFIRHFHRLFWSLAVSAFRLPFVYIINPSICWKLSVVVDRQEYRVVISVTKELGALSVKTVVNISFCFSFAL